MKDKKVLITGGAGFIGSHLSEFLLELGASVTVLDNLTTGLKDNVDLFRARSNFRFVEGDVRDLRLLKNEVSIADAVFHLAAMVSVPLSIEKPDECYELNVHSFNDLILCARERSVPVIYASSAAVYGEGADEGPRREDESLHPLSPYGASKAMDELIACASFRSWGVPSVGMRFFNVYGPRQVPDGPYASVIPRFATALLDGKPLTIYGDGEQTRDFIYVTDIARTLVAACKSSEKLAGSVINVGSGVRSSVNDVYSILSSQRGGDPKRLFADERAGDIKHSYAKLDRLSSFMDLSTFTSLEEGISLTLDYYSQKRS